MLTRTVAAKKSRMSKSGILDEYNSTTRHAHYRTKATREDPPGWTESYQETGNIAYRRIYACQD